MIRVIGVRFRTAGKIYFFDPLNFEIKKGDHVIVETARGIEFGTVVAGISDVDEEKVVQPLKPVIRVANQRDVEQERANRDKEKEAYRVCLEKIHEHKLEMKLIDAEYTFDNNKVLFYFTADGRIDFRELVKDLASIFKTRIELRQIGVRDETKMVGGIGICGRPLCCHSYLADFVPVSIKMAKEQNLSLNPSKISGVCGRLMCCLKNEEETYEELNRRLPDIGDSVTTSDGLKGEVQSVNVLRQLVKVVVDVGDEKEIKEYPVEKLHFRRKHGKKDKVELSVEELQELERLEEAAKEEQQTEKQDVVKPENAIRQNEKNRHENRGSQGKTQRQAGQRGEAARSSQRSEGGKQSGQRTGEGARQFGPRSGEGRKPAVQRGGEGTRQSGEEGQTPQRMEQQSGEGRGHGERQGGRNRYEGRRRQESRNRQRVTRREEAASRENRDYGHSERE